MKVYITNPFLSSTARLDQLWILVFKRSFSKSPSSFSIKSHSSSVKSTLNLILEMDLKVFEPLVLEFKVSLQLLLFPTNNAIWCLKTSFETNHSKMILTPQSLSGISAVCSETSNYYLDTTLLWFCKCKWSHLSSLQNFSLKDM